jgi:multiple antibiotic resistance protein
MFKYLLLSVIPLFVAVDPLGVLPIFVSLTSSLRKKQKQIIIIHSLVTALCLSLAFIFLGKAVFKLLGITISDFMIAGGSILFFLAVVDLIVAGKPRRTPKDDMGVVPIGTPLIVGPAVLTTSLILLEEFGALITAISVIINLVVTGLIFFWSDALIHRFGVTGVYAFSKVMALFLAAIGVMMIRKGLVQFLMVNVY